MQFEKKVAIDKVAIDKVAIDKVAIDKAARDKLAKDKLAKDKAAREKQTVEFMIGMYCKAKHGGKVLCPQCVALRDYAWHRLEVCPLGLAKPACRKCKIHCYQPQMAVAIRQVMAYAGPRLVFFHPVWVFRHYVWRQ